VQVPRDFRDDGLDRLRRVDHAEALRLGGGAREVGGAHALEEGGGFALDAVGLAAAAARARQARIDAEVEQEGEVGLAPRGPALEVGDAAGVDAAAAALVGEAGVGEAVAHDRRAARERRFDELAHQLRARGEHQQQLGLGAQRAARVEQHRADRLARRRAAGFARAHHFAPGGGERIADRGEHGRLARALAALEADQQPAHRLSWYLRTARLCSSRVAEKWCAPPPLATKYSALPRSGCATASSAARPGIAIGVGGRPARV
jgi:hypothetical protein